MNILGKKRWNVWNTDNTLRVLKDEEEHREKQEQEEKRRHRVAMERRVEAMKKGSGAEEGGEGTKGRLQLVDEGFGVADTTGNREAARERKQDEERKLRRMGLRSMALGFGAAERAQRRPWYEEGKAQGVSVLSGRPLTEREQEIRRGRDEREKVTMDPMMDVVRWRAGRGDEEAAAALATRRPTLRAGGAPEHGDGASGDRDERKGRDRARKRHRRKKSRRRDDHSDSGSDSSSSDAQRRRRKKRGLLLSANALRAARLDRERVEARRSRRLANPDATSPGHTPMLGKGRRYYQQYNLRPNPASGSPSSAHSGERLFPVRSPASASAAAARHDR